MYYKPDPDKAYASIQHITNDLTLGWLVRGMHRWGASVFIILMFFHMARVFLFGAYKYPRELNWIIGVLLLALGMLEGFTGYLLPWDQTAYWATVVGINLNGTAPFLGPFLAQFLSGGRRDRRGHAQQVLRAAHARDPGRDLRPDRAAPLPRRSASASRSPPWSTRPPAATGPSRSRRPNGRAGLVRPRRPRGGATMASRRVDERRAEHKRYKEDVEREREAVLPVRDVPRHGDEPRRRGRDRRPRVRLVLHGRRAPRTPGCSGRTTPTEADPGTTSFVPRPDWYFYFLFYLLRIFKWPDSVVLGTVGIPTIAARAPARAAVHRHPPRAAAARAARSRSSRRPRRRSRWACSPTRARPRRRRSARETSSARADVGEEQGFAGQRGGGRGRDALRRVRLPQLPHLPRHRLAATSARPTSRTIGATRHAAIARSQSSYVANPAQVRQQRDAAVRRPRRGEPRTKLADFLDGLQGPRRAR